ETRQNQAPQLLGKRRRGRRPRGRARLYDVEPGLGQVVGRQGRRGRQRPVCPAAGRPTFRRPGRAGRGQTLGRARDGGALPRQGHADRRDRLAGGAHLPLVPALERPGEAHGGRAARRATRAVPRRRDQRVRRDEARRPRRAPRQRPERGRGRAGPALAARPRQLQLRPGAQRRAQALGLRPGERQAREGDRVPERRGDEDVVPQRRPLRPQAGQRGHGVHHRQRGGRHGGRRPRQRRVVAPPRPARVGDAHAVPPADDRGRAVPPAQAHRRGRGAGRAVRRDRAQPGRRDAVLHPADEPRRLCGADRFAGRPRCRRAEGRGRGAEGRDEAERERRADLRRGGPRLLDRLGGQRDPADRPGIRGGHGRRAGRAADLARHVGDARRLPLRRQQPARPPAQLPLRQGPAQAAVRPVSCSRGRNGGGRAARRGSV
ncbi:MAG: hypothetical protein AVDCRST_MAG64-631, partial [uncultured Phycisphaerae bacterium]